MNHLFDDDTVQTLCTAISGIAGLPVGEMILRYGDVLLTDMAKTLCDYNIRNDDSYTSLFERTAAVRDVLKPRLHISRPMEYRH